MSGNAKGVKPLALLLDTNIWMDIYYPERPGHSCANQLLELALNEGIDLHYCAQSLIDAFYLTQSNQKRLMRAELGEIDEPLALGANEVAWGVIKSICDIGTPIPITSPMLFLATKMKDVHADFEDDVLIAAAQISNVDYLVTNDQQLLAKSPVASLSCKDMLGYLRIA